MANEIYTLAYVTIAGRLMTQHASVDVKRASGSSPVHTVHGGYSGESPGSPMCEIAVKQAVPAADFDFEASKNIGKLIPAEIGVYMAGRVCTSKGFIISDSFSHAVDNPANYEFNFRGDYSDFEEQ